MDSLEQRVSNIEERNVRVEADKKWEQSWTRRVAIAVLTYLIICLFLFEIGESEIFLKALVPVFGFVLSTLSIELFRKMSGY